MLENHIQNRKYSVNETNDYVSSAMIVKTVISSTMQIVRY